MEFIERHLVLEEFPAEVRLVVDVGDFFKGVLGSWGRVNVDDMSDENAVQEKGSVLFGTHYLRR